MNTQTKIKVALFLSEADVVKLKTAAARRRTGMSAVVHELLLDPPAPPLRTPTFFPAEVCPSE